MGIRYRLLQTAAALLVALGSVALGGAWAWAQQEESNPAARQGGNCPGAEEVGTVGPTRKEQHIETESFDIEGDKFRLTYKTTDLDEDGGAFLDVIVFDEDEDEVGGRLIREQGTETEIVSEAPGTFSLEIGAGGLRYEITVEDCTGEDQSAADDQYNDGNAGNDGNLGIDDDLGLRGDPSSVDNLGLGDDPGFGTGVGQAADIPEDVIADTIPDRNTLPFTGGQSLFGLALIGLACAGLGIAVLRSAIRRP
jgi:hypothetical protein